MKTKHTPGPWNVEPEWNPGEGFTITAPTARHRIDGERGCICNFAWSPFVDAKEANARLIAAAPELLEALQRLVSDGESVGWGASGNIPASVVHKAMAAIQKATQS